jgi:hypothetical protein
MLSAYDVDAPSLSTMHSLQVISKAMPVLISLAYNIHMYPNAAMSGDLAASLALGG